jgi:nucleoside 2-deoxyribosyltransferase
MGLLKNHSVYLCGPIETCKDFGHGWRDRLTPILNQMGIEVLDPLRCIAHEYNDSTYLKDRKVWKENGEYDKIAALKRIRSIDLRMVDKADFLICYLDTNEKMVGTLEEIFTANRSKKPCLVYAVNGMKSLNDWFYWTLPQEHFFEDETTLIDYVRDIDSGNKSHKRFVLFNKS